MAQLSKSIAAAALLVWVCLLVRELHPPASAADLSNTERGRLEALLVGEERAKHLMQFWPKGLTLARIRASGMILYDDDSTPRVYQVADEGQPLVLSPAVVESANNEFPWRDPAGVGPNTGVRTFRFVQLPSAIKWWRGTNSLGTFAGFRWLYPEGTRFGEVLMVTDSQGFSRAFEVRTRVKRQGKWTVQAYRPFPTEFSFREALRERGWMYHPDLVQIAAVNSGHSRNAFVALGNSQRLPQMTEELVKSLLDNEFVPAKGLEWNELVTSPTSEQVFSLVPLNYSAHFIPVNNQSCMRCHQDAGKVVNLQGERRWRVRGDDGIISFHPFSSDGLRLNRRLVAAGLLQHQEGRP